MIQRLWFQQQLLPQGFIQNAQLSWLGSEKDKKRNGSNPEINEAEPVILQAKNCVTSPTALKKETSMGNSRSYFPEVLYHVKPPYISMVGSSNLGTWNGHSSTNDEIPGDVPLDSSGVMVAPADLLAGLGRATAHNSPASMRVWCRGHPVTHIQFLKYGSCQYT